MDNDIEETREGLSKYRFEKAKESLKSSKLLYNNNDLIGANNRAYYSIFYAIRAVLALEQIDFKKHKDVLAYFNQNYVNMNIFPKNIGRNIAQASKLRERSDYDDKYVPSSEKTEIQIKTAEDVINEVEKYLKENEIL